MLAGALGKLSLLERIKYDSYCTLYVNVRKRLCLSEETLETDFFTSAHFDEQGLAEKYRKKPTAITCWSHGICTDTSLSSNTYLVIGGAEKLVLLLPPEAAIKLNLPYMAVLEGKFFKPHLGCVSAYWQKWIEPDTISKCNTFTQSMKFAMPC